MCRGHEVTGERRLSRGNNSVIQDGGWRSYLTSVLPGVIGRQGLNYNNSHILFNLVGFICLFIVVIFKRI